MRRYRDLIDDDPERLEAVRERLDQLARLCRKYGDHIDDVIAYGAAASERLAELTDAGSTLEELLIRERDLLALLADRAASLSHARRSASGDLVHALARQLGDLAMAGAALSVGFACDEDANGPRIALPEYEVVITERPPLDASEARPLAFSESGVDRIEFLASFNPGEMARPISVAASGGETSRFLLALTVVLGSHGERRVVVLDEADEGVGGRGGALIGRVLATLASKHQVLCITHLPQVASFGQHHFVVTKQTDGQRTWSDVRPVVGDERIVELAAMLGGVSAENCAAASALLAGAP
jgi:DNA repair protein RecN (Recombination protein N)